MAEDCVDSYVPVQSDIPVLSEEYIDMDPVRNHLTANAVNVPQQNANSVSSIVSSCSVTSGTPSTDMRFAEYQLDKIVSHFTPDDDDNHFNERPIRAYSVGSRLEHNKRRMRTDISAFEQANNENTSRVRAFSVGSKAKIARSDIYRNANKSNKTSTQDIVNLITTINNNNNNISNNNHPTTSKSNIANSINNNMSAESRNSKRSISTPTLNTNTKSNSVDPMDDLMEIDFTKREDDTLSNDSNYDQNNRISCDDLMEIDYPHQYPSYGSSASSTGATQGLSHRKKSASISVSGITASGTPTRMSQPVPITSKRNEAAMKTTIDQQKEKDGYISMKPVNAQSPSKSMSRPMNSASPSMRRVSQMPRLSTQPNNTEDYLDMSPISAKSSTSIVSSHENATPEGYMEMSWNRSSINMTSPANNYTLCNNTNSGKSNLRSSSSSISSSNEYINMNFGGNIPRTSSASSDCSSASGSGQNVVTNKTNRLRSMPITIQTKKLPQSVASCQHAMSAAMPPNHLPQNSVGNKNFPPNTLKINTNISSALNTCESMDESENVTPTASDATQHSSAIFPFSPNSPNNGNNKPIFSSQQSSSHKNSNHEEQKRKCLVDGTTGKIILIDFSYK